MNIKIDDKPTHVVRRAAGAVEAEQIANKLESEGYTVNVQPDGASGFTVVGKRSTTQAALGLLGEAAVAVIAHGRDIATNVQNLAVDVITDVQRIKREHEKTVATREFREAVEPKEENNETDSGQGSDEVSS